MKRKNRLILIRGLPGSGKSTYAKTMFKGILHLENDMFHMVDGKYRFNSAKQNIAVIWCMKSAEIALRNGMDVVVSNTFTRKEYIDDYKSIAEGIGCGFKVFRMCGNYGNVHDVPKEVLESMANNFEDYEGEIIVNPMI